MLRTGARGWRLLVVRLLLRWKGWLRLVLCRLLGLVIGLDWLCLLVGGMALGGAQFVCGGWLFFQERLGCWRQPGLYVGACGSLTRY